MTLKESFLQKRSQEKFISLSEMSDEDLLKAFQKVIKSMIASREAEHHFEGIHEIMDDYQKEQFMEISEKEWERLRDLVGGSPIVIRLEVDEEALKMIRNEFPFTGKVRQERVRPEE